MQAWLARFLPWAVLAITLTVTYNLWKDARQNATQELQSRFDLRVRPIHGYIEQRMQAYEQVLRGVDGLFAHDHIVKRNEFRDYVDRLKLEENYPGIQGVGFALIVPKTARGRHIAAIRNEGFTAYTIKPDGERDIYTSVIYIEPFNERNLRAFGYDMYSDQEYPRTGDSASGLRRTAMERARDSGNAAISSKTRLIVELETDKKAQAGFLMYLPIYKYGAPHGTLAERRTNIIGWVYAPFRMDNLMVGIFGELAAEIDIEVYDGKEMSDEAMMYDSDAHRAKSRSKLSDARFQAVNSLDIAGHTWTVAIRSLPDFEALLDRGKPGFVAFAGIGASLQFALLTWFLVHGRERALQEARRMNRELIESRNQLEELSMFMQVAVEVERKRIARELHDELGQTMTALCFDLSWISENLDVQGNRIRDKLLSMSAMVNCTVDAIHRISEDLRPGMLDDLGLAAAIENHVTEFSERTGMPCKIFISPLTPGIGDMAATALFRIVQESLTNVTRHSGASLVTVYLQELEDQILLIVQDNGRGFSLGQDVNKKTYGLLGMRERVKMLGGTLNISTEPGSGVRIEAEVPKRAKEYTQ